MSTSEKIKLLDREFHTLDLTHTLNLDIPTWNASCGFESTTVMDYDQSGILVKKYKCHAGIGTHMDAPTHFYRGGLDIAEIPLDKLIVPVCKIDVSKQAHQGYMISKQNILDYEEDRGPIQPHSLIVADTGWSARWSKPKTYRNEMKFPGYSLESATYLMSRDIVGIGIDTLSPDGSDMTFPVHQLILGGGKYIT